MPAESELWAKGSEKLDAVEPAILQVFLAVESARPPPLSPLLGIGGGGLVTTHGDIHGANVVRTSGGTLLAIDMESARLDKP